MNYRTPISLHIIPNSPTDAYLYENMRKRGKVQGSTISSDKKINPDAYYLVTGRTELDAARVLYTLEMTDGSVPVAPAPEPKIQTVTGYTRQSLINAGWTPELLAEHGYFEVPIVVSRADKATQFPGGMRAPNDPPSTEPTMADLMREIHVLQRMVAAIGQSAHGAPLMMVRK